MFATLDRSEHYRVLFTKQTSFDTILNSCLWFSDGDVLNWTLVVVGRDGWGGGGRINLNYVLHLLSSHMVH